VLHSYRQFVDQVLELPGDVTVIVDRNDAGKTGLLVRLIDHRFFERVIHGADQSRVPGPEVVRRRLIRPPASPAGVDT
jgi:hypothetical protein